MIVSLDLHLNLMGCDIELTSDNYHETGVSGNNTTNTYIYYPVQNAFSLFYNDESVQDIRKEISY